jgi:hypothetical protein
MRPSVIQHILVAQLQSYQQAGYSIRTISRLMRCSRKIVRLMRANDWHHPLVQSYLHRAPHAEPEAMTRLAPAVVAAHPPRPRVTRVGYRESWRQHQRGSVFFD